MKMLYAAVAAVAVMPAAAAANNTSSGSSRGLNWEANSTIVGQTGTGTVATGGDARYLAPNSAGYSGVAGMLMTYANGNQFVCTGSLLTSGKILTAAHCVSDGAGATANGVANGLIRTQVLFQNAASSAADAAVYGLPAGVTAIDVAGYNVHWAYTGEVIDQNDIVVLTLAEAAPAFAQAYDIYNGGDLTGDTFNVTGYGTRSVTGGVDGTTGPGAGAGVGRRRQGDNIYDYRLGDAAFDGFFTDREAGGETFFGSASVEYSFISDFDRTGFAANSQSCLLAAALVSGGLAGARALGFCTNGLGPNEVGIAGGDSGGAAFINGQIASVNSYSLSFGAGFGDFKCDPPIPPSTAPRCLNSSWGELAGYVPTYIHTDFINGVPEPGTWAMMILGFGFVGGALRRRGKSQLSFA